MWELVSFLQSNIRRSCLKELSGGPTTPQNIAKKTKNHLTHTSRALKELEKKELVECLTPDLTKNRFYQITDLGKQVLEKVREVEDAG